LGLRRTKATSAPIPAVDVLPTAIAALAEMQIGHIVLFLANCRRDSVVPHQPCRQT
jgi:hypothetical protein